MNITDIPLSLIDMKALRFNPWHGDSMIPIQRKYVELAKAWAGTKLSDIALHYICVVYDTNNPTKLYTDNRIDQKKMAALFCGWPTEAGEFNEPYISYLAGCNTDFNKAIISFVKIFNSASYTHLTTLFHQYDQICATLLSSDGDDGNDKKTEIEKTKTRAEVVDKLDALYKKIKEVEADFLGESDCSMNKELYKLMKDETKNYGINAEGRLKLKEKQ